MTWTNKVIWTEGMFLQPQHFQQHDRYLTQQIQARLGSAAAYGWGYAALTLDSAALSLGKVAITAAQGVTPDGVAFDVPGQDPAPAAFDVPADARDQLAVLAVTLQRRGVAETDAESDANSMPPRYHSAEVDVGDTNVTRSGAIFGVAVLWAPVIAIFAKYWIGLAPRAPRARAGARWCRCAAGRASCSGRRFRQTTRCGRRGRRAR